MGITTEQFFENIYSVIFCPKEFYEREDITKSTRLAILTVVSIALIAKLAFDIFNRQIQSVFYVFGLGWFLISRIFIWFLTALFFEYIAKIFDKGGKLPDILFYTAFAPIPYIFFAPLNLLKNTGDFGYFIGVVLEVLLYFWIIYLYALSLRKTYDITLSRSFMLIFLPFIASFFALYWLVCFISKIWYIFSV